jgi:MFS family permease
MNSISMWVVESMVFLYLTNATKNIEAWQMDTLVTMPTLFMAVGSFLWIPLTIGMGRRPVFLVASVTLIVACIGAGYSQSFPQLLACICFLGLAEGFALTAVSSLNFPNSEYNN